MTYTRFAVYFLPPQGALARFGATWLGWDIETGQPMEHAFREDQANGQADPQADRRADAQVEATARPAKYGFHATLKPPFRLAEGTGQDDLKQALRALCTGVRPGTCAGLRLQRLGRFLALVPEGPDAEINAVAAAMVTELDRFRASPSPAELERRRKPGLSAAQLAMLDRWGYPYVLETFRFHMTLTGPVPRADLPLWEQTVAEALPPLPAPFVLDQVALVGERADGKFELIERIALTG